jgi:hypothetical protein
VTLNRTLTDVEHGVPEGSPSVKVVPWVRSQIVRFAPDKALNFMT